MKLCGAALLNKGLSMNPAKHILSFNLNNNVLIPDREKDVSSFYEFDHSLVWKTIHDNLKPEYRELYVSKLLVFRKASKDFFNTEHYVCLEGLGTLAIVRDIPKTPKFPLATPAFFRERVIFGIMLDGRKNGLEFSDIEFKTEYKTVLMDQNSKLWVNDRLNGRGQFLYPLN